jgi:glycosyltransferase involved in cell wall biosynthesis
MRIFVNEFCGHPFQLQLSRELARRGHVVCHVYFKDNTSTPKGNTQPLPDDPPTLSIEGLQIRRKFAKYSLLSRRGADVEYGEVAASRMRRFRPDVVISANMPLDGQRILQRESRLLGAKFVFWLQDLYSMAVRFVLAKKLKALVSLGNLYFEGLEKRLLHRSDAVVCIANGFANHLSKWKIDPAKVHVIGNWAPLDEVVPTAKRNEWAFEHGVAERFCFMYSGTLGMKHRPELLLELARSLEQRSDARLVIIAGGAGAEWLASRAGEIDPEALTLLPYQSYDRLSQVMGAADVLITLLDSEAGEFAVPSKVLSYLCSGRPILIAAPRANEAVRIVEEAGAGVAVSPDDPQDIVAAAKGLLDNPDLCRHCGESGRRFAEDAFCIRAIADQFVEIFNALDRPADRRIAVGRPSATPRDVVRPLPQTR